VQKRGFVLERLALLVRSQQVADGAVLLVGDAGLSVDHRQVSLQHRLSQARVVDELEGHVLRRVELSHDAAHELATEDETEVLLGVQ
jgi:hypothetical protein